MPIELGNEVPDAALAVMPEQYRRYARRLTELSVSELAVEQVQSQRTRPTWLADLGMAFVTLLAAAREVGLTSGQPVDLGLCANKMGKVMHDSHGCGSTSEQAYNLIEDVLHVADTAETDMAALDQLSTSIQTNPLLTEFVHWSNMTRLLNRECASRGITIEAVTVDNDDVSGVLSSALADALGRQTFDA